MSQAQFKYEGSELDLFQLADNWKAYWSSMINDRIRGNVLEVGAGSGSNTLVLTKTGSFKTWTALEPDPGLAQMISRQRTHKKVKVIAGDLSSLGPEEKFDTVLYLDVLEHIKDDSLEIKNVARLLSPQGHLIILVPAHQWLFSPFDRSIGHFRRYNRQSLCGIVGAQDFSPVFVRYLDCCGVFLSALNCFILRRSLPHRKDILFWDRQVVPVSKPLDRLLNYTAGKSLLGVWRRNEI